MVNFSFADTIQSLKEVGVFEYVLPFLLVFSIFFAILEKTKILGENKTNINVIVSSVIALLVLVQQGIVATINLFLPRVSLIIIVILMGLLIIAMIAGKEFQGLQGSLFSVAVIIVIIAVLLAVFLPESNSVGGFSLSPSDRQFLISYVLPIGLFILAVFWVTKKPAAPNKEGGISKILKAINYGVK